MIERTIILKTTINKNSKEDKNAQKIMDDHLNEIQGIFESQKVSTIIITTTVEIR